MFLAVIFTSLQGFEYNVADFRLSDGVLLVQLFTLATGFHGFHVIVGTVFLFICMLRLLQYQMTQQHHFGFEAAA